MSSAKRKSFSLNFIALKRFGDGKAKIKGQHIPHIQMPLNRVSFLQWNTNIYWHSYHSCFYSLPQVNTDTKWGFRVATGSYVFPIKLNNIRANPPRKTYKFRCLPPEASSSTAERSIVPMFGLSWILLYCGYPCIYWGYSAVLCKHSNTLRPI